MKKLNKILMFSAIAVAAVGVLGAGVVKLTGCKYEDTSKKKKKSKIHKINK